MFENERRELEKVIGKKIVGANITTSPSEDKFTGFYLEFDDGTSLDILSLTCSKLDENREVCENLGITLIDSETGEKRKAKCNSTLGGGMAFAFDDRGKEGESVKLHTGEELSES